MSEKCMNSGMESPCPDCGELCMSPLGHCQNGCNTTVIFTAELEELRGVYDATMSNTRYELVDTFSFNALQVQLKEAMELLEEMQSIIGDEEPCCKNAQQKWERLENAFHDGRVESFLKGGQDG